MKSYFAIVSSLLLLACSGEPSISVDCSLGTQATDGISIECNGGQVGTSQPGSTTSPLVSSGADGGACAEEKLLGEPWVNNDSGLASYGGLPLTPGSTWRFQFTLDAGETMTSLALFVRPLSVPPVVPTKGSVFILLSNGGTPDQWSVVATLTDDIDGPLYGEVRSIKFVELDEGPGIYQVRAQGPIGPDASALVIDAPIVAGMACR